MVHLLKINRFNWDFFITWFVAKLQAYNSDFEKLDERPKGPLSDKYIYLLKKMKKLIYTSKELKDFLHLDDNDTESESSEEDQQQKQEGAQAVAVTSSEKLEPTKTSTSSNKEETQRVSQEDQTQKPDKS